MQVHRAPLELRNAPTILTDKVVVILGQLVARTVAKVQPAYQPTEKVERPVYRHHPNLGTAGPYLLQTLMSAAIAARIAKRCGVTLYPHPRIFPTAASKLTQDLILMERVFHLQGSKNVLVRQSGWVGRIMGWLSRSAKSL